MKSSVSSTSAVPVHGKLPRHVAVIMDGNGRWAKARGLPRIAGHRKGVEVVRDLVKACAETGIEYLTLFAFSSENWRRPQREVSLLMELFGMALDREIIKLHQNNIQFRVIGDIDAFGGKLSKKILDAQNLTAKNDGLVVTVAANYGGRWDIANACKAVAEEVKKGTQDIESITPEVLEKYLCLHEAPEPDLFIRTGGERRVSNFLLWQLAYTELYFTEVLWPDFDNAEFEKALASYATRQRRFGLTGDQIETAKHA